MIVFARLHMLRQSKTLGRKKQQQWSICKRTTWTHKEPPKHKDMSSIAPKSCRAKNRTSCTLRATKFRVRAQNSAQKLILNRASKRPSDGRGRGRARASTWGISSNRASTPLFGKSSRHACDCTIWFDVQRFAACRAHFPVTCVWWACVCVWMFCLVRVCVCVWEGGEGGGVRGRV